VPGRPRRLLFSQLGLIYFVNGLYKMSGGEWVGGSLMHYVAGNLAWTRWSYDELPVPLLCLRLMTWTVLTWEFCFPALVLMPCTRTGTLVLGIMFHLGTAAMLLLGPFPFYMICLYLPLAPWERWLAPSSSREDTLERSGPIRVQTDNSGYGSPSPFTCSSRTSPSSTVR
jgi:hypothetical protein